MTMFIFDLNVTTRYTKSPFLQKYKELAHVCHTNKLKRTLNVFVHCNILIFIQSVGVEEKHFDPLMIILHLKSL